MLKLTRALLLQAEEIQRRLLKHLLEQSRYTIEENDLLFSQLTVGVVSGILHRIDQQLEDDPEVTGQKLLTQLPAEQREAHLYLGRLTITQGSIIFLQLENIVMNSGSGTGFKRWKKAWQLTLLNWMSHIEQSRIIKDQLSTLTSLSRQQKDFHDTHLFDFQQLAISIEEHLQAYLSGRGALTQHLVFILNPEPSYSWLQIFSFLSKKLVEKDSTFEVTPYILSCRFSPFGSSFIELLEQLFTEEQLRQYTLLSCLLYGLQMPKIYKQSPALSRKVWLLKELVDLVQQTEELPQVICIEHAESLAEGERELWATWFEAMKLKKRAFILILLPHDKTFTEQDEYLKPFWRKNILCECYEAVTSNSEPLSLARRIRDWDEEWTTALLGHSLNLSKQDIVLNLVNLWHETLFELSSEVQTLLLYLLGITPLHRLTNLTKDHHYIVLLDKLVSGGWLYRDGDQYFAIVHILQDWVNRFIESPSVLVQTLPKAAKTLHALLEAELLLMDEFISVAQSNNLDFSQKESKTGLMTHSIQRQKNRLHTYQTLLESHLYPSRVSQNNQTQQENIVLIREFALDRMSSAQHPSLVERSSNTQLQDWLNSELTSFRERFERESIAHLYQSLQPLIEVAGTVGDLFSLAELFMFEAKLSLNEGRVIQAIDVCSHAHELYEQLGQDESAFSCRSFFIGLLCQSGHHELAGLLIHAEKTSAEVQSQDTNTLAFLEGLLALHQQEWSQALSYFSSITIDYGDVLILRAFATLQHLNTLPNEPKFFTDNSHIRENYIHLLSLCSRAEKLKPSTFDLGALGAWVKIEALIRLDKLEEASLCFKQILNQLSKLTTLTRGHCYVYAITRLMLKINDQAEILMNDQVEIVEKLDQNLLDLEDLWSETHQAIGHYLQGAPNVLAKLLNPQAHFSSTRSISRFPQKARYTTPMLWELSLICESKYQRPESNRHSRKGNGF